MLAPSTLEPLPGVVQSEQNLCVTICEDDKFTHTDTILAVRQC